MSSSWQDSCCEGTQIGMLFSFHLDVFGFSQPNYSIFNRICIKKFCHLMSNPVNNTQTAVVHTITREVFFFFEECSGTKTIASVIYANAQRVKTVYGNFASDEILNEIHTVTLFARCHLNPRSRNLLRYFPPLFPCVLNHAVISVISTLSVCRCIVPHRFQQIWPSHM